MELCLVHQAIFRTEPADGLVADYEAACGEYPELATPVLAGARRLTPFQMEALEYYLRLTRSGHPLSRRFAVVSYLAEARPPTNAEYRRLERCRGALFALAAHGVRAAILLALGSLLSRRADA